MTAAEIMTAIVSERFYNENPNTVDILKLGDGEREVAKLAMCHMATPDVIRAAADWGADMLITHEPLFYNHVDKFEGGLLPEKKRALIEKAGFPIFRYHDSMHFRDEDEVSRAFIEMTELKGEWDGAIAFKPDQPVSAEELAAIIEEKLNIKHVRIVGDKCAKTRGVTLALGARGGGCVSEMIDSDDTGICVYGELCEWCDCEQVRDAAQLGMGKALLVLGHTASERFGMEWKAGQLASAFPGVEVKYFDCGDVYDFAE